MPNYYSYSQRLRTEKYTTPPSQILNAEFILRFHKIIDEFFDTIGPNCNVKQEYYISIISTICNTHLINIAEFRRRYSQSGDLKAIVTYMKQINKTQPLFAIDVLELICMEMVAYDPVITSLAKTPAEIAISEVNLYLKANNIGYRFENGFVISSNHTPIEDFTINQAFKLIKNIEYASINDEYSDAHKSFRNDNFEGCNGNCRKAFESTLKIICKKKNWKYSDSDTSKPLVNILRINNYFSEFHHNHISALVNLLETQISSIANRNGSHGRGPKEKSRDRELSSFLLKVTGSTIVFLLNLE